MARPKAEAGSRRLRSLIPDVLHEPFGPHFGAVDVAGGIGRDTFRRARAAGLLDRVRNERGHDAVADPSDADAALPAVVVLRNRFRFGIGDVDDVVLVDEHAARPAELEPLVEIVAVLIEDLDAVVLPVGDEQPAALVHRERVRDVDLARTRALRPPRLDELAVPVDIT